MRKIIVPLFLAISLVGCKTQMKDVTKVDPNQFSKTITSSELSDYLYTFSSDDFSRKGHRRAWSKESCRVFKGLL